MIVMQMMLFSRNEARFFRGSPINSSTHIPFPAPQLHSLILMFPYFLTKACLCMPLGTFPVLYTAPMTIF